MATTFNINHLSPQNQRNKANNMIEIINARFNQESRILHNSPSKMGISGS
jgi:hypothetical protein